VELRSLLAALDDDDESAVAAARERVDGIQARSEEVRQDAIALLAEYDPDLDRSDTNYVFLTFVLGFLPAGLVGLVLAAILSASMSSTSAELNALASTTVVDLYKRFWRPDAGERHSVRVSKGLTVFWGALAILFAESAARLGSLVEAVNILGSLFYGTILGVFLLAFYGGRRVDGTSVFVAALVAEAMVVACWLLDAMAFLWLNAVGCLAVVVVGLLLAALRKQPPPSLVNEARQE
jgi:SSS family solute:Na+ symporter